MTGRRVMAPPRFRTRRRWRPSRSARVFALFPHSALYGFRYVGNFPEIPDSFCFF
jgi:hypothetical protein